MSIWRSENIAFDPLTETDICFIQSFHFNKSFLKDYLFQDS